MNAYRPHRLAAALIPFFLFACSGKEATQPPPAKAAKAEPSQSPAAAPPVGTEAQKEGSKASPPATTRPEGSAAREAVPPPPSTTSLPTPAAAPVQPAKQKEPSAASETQQPAPKTPPPPPAQVPAKQAPETPPAKAPENAIILKATLGGVRFEHKTHSESRKIACLTCHHESRPEKPATLPQQACRQCHTPLATPPMKTKLQNAFHNATATAGTCIDCHKVGSAKGQAPPLKCLDCHKKEYK